MKYHIRNLNKIITIFSLFAAILILIGISYSSKPNIQKSVKSVTSRNLTKPKITIIATISPIISNTLYNVLKVIDGDTINVSINGKSETLRLIGIDTPETVDPRKPVQCFGREASNKAKEILSGKKVFLESDPTQGERDKYNRLLRYVFLEDGTFYNKFMISDGFAHEYTYNLPYKYQKEFKKAQTEAMNNKKGLWADNACNNFVNTTPVITISVIPNSGNYSCNGKTKCTQMINCEEAKFYLNSCGASTLDGDKDGTPCESLCN